MVVKRSLLTPFFIIVKFEYESTPYREISIYFPTRHVLVRGSDMPIERFTSAFSNANGSIGLCLATLALILVLTYGYLSFSDAVLAAEPIDLKARRPNLG